MKDNHKSWKESKLFIAIASGAATATFIILLFSTIIIPTLTQKCENEKYKLQQLVPEYPKLIKNLEEKNKENLELKAKLNAYRMENIFKDKIPYPLGFRGIKIGDNISKVKIIYSNNMTNYPNTVYIEHDLFNYIMYHTLKIGDLEGTTISGITFMIKNENGQKLTYELLKRKLIESFPSHPYKEGKNRLNETEFIMENVKGINIRLTPRGLSIDQIIKIIYR